MCCREQKKNLSTHSALTERLSVRGRELMDMGILEQDLVFGAANSKDVITFAGRPGFSPAEKVRAAASIPGSWCSW